MARIFFGGRKIRGLSTDTKPTAPEDDAEFYETNTKKTFDWSGSAWVERVIDTSTDVAETITMNGKTTTFENWVTFRQDSNWTCSSTSGLTVTATGKTTGTCTYTTPADSLIDTTLLEQKKSGGLWETVAANSASGQNITGLDEDSSYQFRTKCTNFFGDSSVTTSGSIATWIEPTDPSSCTSVRDGGTQDFDVAFTGSNSGSSGLSITYKIQRRADSGSWVDTSQTAQTGITWKDTTTHTEGVAYTYRVIATNSAGDSAYSAASNATTIPANPVTGYGNANKSSIEISGYDTYEYLTAGTSTFTINAAADVMVLVVGAGGGGGGGWYGGGGAGGGIVHTDEYSLAAGTYDVVLNTGTTNHTSFDGHEAGGGTGGVAGYYTGTVQGGNGGGLAGAADGTNGSGGGGGGGQGTLRSGISGNTYGGYNGGSGHDDPLKGGGGAGAGAAGSNTTGGSCKSITTFGGSFNRCYAGGGGGNRQGQETSTGGGGNGGGGATNGSGVSYEGSYPSVTANTAEQNSGSGGGQKGGGGSRGKIVIRVNRS
jgi:hypothetical protein